MPFIRVRDNFVFMCSLLGFLFMAARLFLLVAERGFLGAR